MGYSYPLRTDWSTEEIITVTAFFEVIEKAYEEGIERNKVIVAYREFKKIVPSMSEEKTLLKEFEEASGYVGFYIVKAAQEGKAGEIIKGKQR